jgi:hypothetical protein
MAGLTYYAAKIEECRRLLESSNDPLYRDVYQAMADEFAEKLAGLASHPADDSGHGTADEPAPPSPLLYRLKPTVPTQGDLILPPRNESDRRRRRKRGAGLVLRSV